MIMNRNFFIRFADRYLLLLLAMFPVFVQADSVVVFNEVMYNPATTNEAAFEWVELHNQNAVDVDLSGWYFSEGIEFEFPPGTVISGGGFIVVAATPTNLTGQGVAPVVGPFTGRLANGGEDLVLRDLGHRRMDELDYGDEEEWPVGPDGGGASLSKRHPDLGSDRPENWFASRAVGGTPGAPNVVDEQPMHLVFNELSAESTDSFWLELMNAGTNDIELASTIVTCSGIGSPSHILPPSLLAPGEHTVLTQVQLGFGASAGEKLYLYTPGGTNLLDAVLVEAVAQARLPEREGTWQVPSAATPGTANQFDIPDDIVINEVMYNYPPTPAGPAVTTNLLELTETHPWRYDDTGTDQGTAWRAPGFDDALWKTGSGVMGFSAPAADTLLDAGHTTYYFRTTFELTGSVSTCSLDLSFLAADGAVLYVNGDEVHRVNLPDGAVNHTTPATDPLANPSMVLLEDLLLSNLIDGTNVLAVEVHQPYGGLNSTGLQLSGGGLALVEQGPFGGAPPSNLARMPGVTPFAIDSLAGFPIHDIGNLNDGNYGNAFSWIGNSGDPGYCGLDFNGTNTISSVAFGRDNLGQFTYRTFGLYVLEYTQTVSPGTGTPSTGNPATGWATVGTIDYQAVGTGLFTHPSRRHRFTFNPVQATGIRLLVPQTSISGGTCIDELEVNPPLLEADAVFSARLTVKKETEPARDFTESTEEWVELFNRGTNAVDLINWRFDRDLDFAFTNSVVIPPGEFLVVARDAAALQAKWPESAGRIIGDFGNRLRVGKVMVLKDPNGNTVDAVRIDEVGFSNGDGASLELIDPRADNRNFSAWRDSDERTGSVWEDIVYRGIAGQTFGSSVYNEFRLSLLDAGELLVDDVQVIRDPYGAAIDQVQNGDFEITSGNTHWRLLGNHGSSRIIPDPDDAGNHVLKVVATSGARSYHNLIESTYAGNMGLIDGALYEVRLRARWQAGTPLLHTAGYQHRLARVTPLRVPSRLGTPGQVNSTFEPNAGPTFTELRHHPVTPAAGEPVTVSVRAEDPDGVASATLFHRLDPSATFTSEVMNLESNGVYRAVLPGSAAGQVVQFYVEATDGQATATAPRAGPDSRALYQVADGQAGCGTAHELRVIQLAADRDFMRVNTNRMSQARVGATVVYKGSEVYYDAGVRFKGSAAARPNDTYVGYSIAFPADQPFRGVHDSIGIDRSNRAPATRQQHEVYVLHMFQQAGLPAHHVDLCYLIAPWASYTGPGILQLGGYDGTFVDEQFESDGSVFNYDLIYEPINTAGGGFEDIKLPSPWRLYRTDLADLGDDQEQYRSTYSIRTNRRRDDFTGIIRLAKTMGAPQEVFDSEIATALDVDEALRVTALTVLCGINDNYLTGVNQHNLKLFTPNDGGPVKFLPWDMDFVFSHAPDRTINPGHNMRKFMNNGATRRLYYGHVNDLLNTVFDSAYMTPWLAHYGSVVCQDYSSQVGYFDDRTAYAISQLPAAEAFAITTNSGDDFSVTTPTVTLEGTAWIDVKEIRRAGQDQPLPVTWGETTWSVTLPLELGFNFIDLEGIGFDGGAMVSDQITVFTITPGGGVDSDGDGMPDGWEQANGTLVGVADGHLDDDLDGLSNFEEYLSGTDPKSPTSVFLLDAPRLEDGRVRLEFRAAAGRAYSVQYRDALDAGDWHLLTNVLAQVTAYDVEVIDDPVPGARRYYRAVTPPLLNPSISLTTDIINEGSAAPTWYANGANNNGTDSTLELIRFIGNSDTSPINVAYNQAGDQIDVSPWVTSGASRGAGQGIKVNGYSIGGGVPGLNLYLRDEPNVNNPGFGAHANWIVTLDLDDIRTVHFGGADQPLQLTGSFGAWGGIGGTDPSHGVAQGAIFLDGVRIDSMPETIANPTASSPEFDLTIHSGRYLTFGIFNGADTYLWDDGVFEDVRLTLDVGGF
jgi:hypothetical protein